jgi:hypothetical protein
MPVSCTYLECVGGTNNKFYLSIDVGNGKSLVGYGPKQRNGGAWSLLPTSEANDRTSTRIGEYTQTSPAQMPPSVRDRLISNYMKYAGKEIEITAAGTIEFVGAGAAPASSGPRPRPPRQKFNPSAANALKGWF